MDNKLVSEIERELNTAVNAAIGEFEDLRMCVEVKLVENDEINARVGRVCRQNKAYKIEINTGVIESLKLALEDKYMHEVDEHFFLDYQFADSGRVFQYFDDSTLKNSFMNGMAKFIEYNILFHECGHILLGHCDNNSINITERNSGDNGKIGYGHQAREFMADWYGMKKAMTVSILACNMNSDFSIYNKSVLLLIRKIFVMNFLALYCQFDLFEAVSKYKNICSRETDEFSEFKLKRRSHPHPYIRLFYGVDALKEAIMDIIELNNEVDSDTSEMIVNELVQMSMNDIFGFFEKMGLNIMQFVLYRPTLIENHINIRKKASSPKHSAKPYINFKMQKMPMEYLNSLRESKKVFFEAQKKIL